MLVLLRTTSVCKYSATLKDPIQACSFELKTSWRTSCCLVRMNCRRVVDDNEDDDADDDDDDEQRRRVQEAYISGMRMKLAGARGWTAASETS